MGRGNRNKGRRHRKRKAESSLPVYEVNETEVAELVPRYTSGLDRDHCMACKLFIGKLIDLDIIGRHGDLSQEGIAYFGSWKCLISTKVEDFRDWSARIINLYQDLNQLIKEYDDLHVEENI